LEEAADADVIVHVVDASHPAWEQQAEVVGEVLGHVLEERAASPASVAPVVMVLNKADLLSSSDGASRLAQLQAQGLAAHLVSAATGEGISALSRGLPRQ